MPKEATVKKLRPMPGKVVVELAEFAEQTKSGLYLPDTARETMNQGRVYAIPEETTDETETIPFVSVGDFVVFSKHAGVSLTFKSTRQRDLVVLREADILTIVDYDFEPDRVEVEARPEVEDVVGLNPITETRD